MIDLLELDTRLKGVKQVAATTRTSPSATQVIDRRAPPPY